MVRAQVPATTANLGPGFDVLGLALDMHNTFSLEEREEGVLIEVSGNGAERLATDERNLVYIAAKRLFDEVGKDFGGLRIGIDIAVPLGRGLGSSSTAIVGGLAAANELTGAHLTKQRLFELATDIEGHPDNVGPAIFGGFTICYAHDGAVSAATYEPSSEIKPVLLIPSSTLETKKARGVLPDDISMSDAVFNIGRSSLLVSALLTGKTDVLRDATQDRLHQPHRASLVPGMARIIEGLSLHADIGVALSGAGPSVLCLVARSRESESLERIRGVVGESAPAYSVVPAEFDLGGVSVSAD